MIIIPQRFIERYNEPEDYIHIEFYVDYSNISTKTCLKYIKYFEYVPFQYDCNLYTYDHNLNIIYPTI